MRLGSKDRYYRKRGRKREREREGLLARGEEMASLALRRDHESGGTTVLERDAREGGYGGKAVSLQMEKGTSSRMTDQLAPSAQENLPTSYNEVSL